jgi:hypothetical protein
MANKPVGSLWLQKHFQLNKYKLSHRSFIGARDRVELYENGEADEIFGPKYEPKSSDPLSHIEFSLKYDDLNLEFLKAVFERIAVEDVAAYIAVKPSGKYGRYIGFFYEFLTGHQLQLLKPISGNYVDLLDNEKYITGKQVKNVRWHITNNLLGENNFCPVIRRTKALQTLLQSDLKKQIEQLTKSYPPEIFYRATNYLYTKETRSSYEIEKEKPSPERVQRFITLLTKAGEQPGNMLLREDNLTKLQNEIVDPRFAVSGYRDFQNYIGQLLPNFNELIHYICPPPAYLNSIMQGLMSIVAKTEGAPPVVRAAVIAFGFVFAHPFEDGNGRLHRFLIHDMLTRDGIVPKGLIIPVSAHMLSNMKEYNQALEAYSVPLMQRISYDKIPKKGIIVTNPGEVEGYFRYPDLTQQSVYLAHTLEATITNDMMVELEFLLHYDKVKKELQAIVDMPDKDTDLIITFLHQNKGILPNRRRKYFSKLTDPEIEAIEKAFQEVFQFPSSKQIK